MKYLLSLFICILFCSSFSLAWFTKNKVESLPGIPNITNIYTGRVSVEDNYNSSLFYWLVEKPDATPTTPVLIWLNGGPGCGSEVGLFIEHGPYLLLNDASIKQNPYSLSTLAHVFYIDNPVGTGFSFVNSEDAYRKDETTIKLDLYTAFITLLNEVFPQYNSSSLYLAGESYAGKYLPVIAKHILDQNAIPGKKYMELKGIAFGNTLVDPISQRVEYFRQLYANSIFDDSEIAQLESINEKCSADIKRGKWIEASDSCDLIAKYISVKSSDINIYDLRKFGIPFNRSVLINYIQQPTFYSSISLDPEKRDWVECNSKVKMNLKGELMKSVLGDVSDLINEERIKVMFYSGQFDIKDGPMGTQKFLKTLPYVVGNVLHTKNPKKIANFTADSVAYIREFNKFSFVVVTGAGHFSPMDNPLAVHHVFESWMGQSGELCNGLKCYSEYDSVCPLLSNCNAESQKGSCVNGVCQCKQGWIGPDCSFSIVPITNKDPTMLANVTSLHNNFYLLNVSTFCENKNQDHCELLISINLPAKESLRNLELYFYEENPFTTIPKITPVYAFSSILFLDSALSLHFNTMTDYYVQFKNPSSTLNGVVYTINVSVPGKSKAVILVPIFVIILLVFIFIAFFMRKVKRRNDPFNYDNIMLNETNKGNL